MWKSCHCLCGMHSFLSCFFVVVVVICRMQNVFNIILASYFEYIPGLVSLLMLLLVLLLLLLLLYNSMLHKMCQFSRNEMNDLPFEQSACICICICTLTFCLCAFNKIENCDAVCLTMICTHSSPYIWKTIEKWYFIQTNHVFRSQYKRLNVNYLVLYLLCIHCHYYHQQQHHHHNHHRRPSFAPQ